MKIDAVERIDKVGELRVPLNIIFLCLASLVFLNGCGAYIPMGPLVEIEDNVFISDDGYVDSILFSYPLAEPYPVDDIAECVSTHHSNNTVNLIGPLRVFEDTRTGKEVELMYMTTIEGGQLFEVFDHDSLVIAVRITDHFEARSPIGFQNDYFIKYLAEFIQSEEALKITFLDIKDALARDLNSRSDFFGEPYPRSFGRTGARFFNGGLILNKIYNHLNTVSQRIYGCLIRVGPEIVGGY